MKRDYTGVCDILKIFAAFSAKRYGEVLYNQGVGVHYVQEGKCHLEWAT